MDREKLDQIINIIAKGDTGVVEGLFDRACGRKFPESVVLMAVCSVPTLPEDKEDLFVAFGKGLDMMERRIKRQKEGQQISRQVYR